MKVLDKVEAEEEEERKKNEQMMKRDGKGQKARRKVNVDKKMEKEKVKGGKKKGFDWDSDDF